MNYGFVIDNRKCIGCHACTVACKSEHEVPLGVNRTHVKYIEKGLFPFSTREFSVHRCNHCEDAPCVEICPTAALYTRADGIVDFDNDRCIGCKSCLQACPYEALYIDPNTRTAAKCNYCAHRLDRGYEPACVVICPVEAIVSGDLDDPGSAIAGLTAREAVTVRKPEKNTQPNLFYLDGDSAMLNPLSAPRPNAYLWSEQISGVGHFAVGGTSLDSRAVELVARELEEESSARRVYDTPSQGILWGWEVPAYILTKAVATGAFLVTTIFQWLGGSLALGVETAALATTLLFLVLTAVLLVKDLDRHDRFLYVLLRPNWSSWLTRGAYIITVLGGLVTMNLIGVRLGWPVGWLGPPGVILAILGAVYTAFLLAQARGRDFWQSPLSAADMLVHALVGGAVVLAVLEPALAGILREVLKYGLLVHLGLLVLEVTTPHGSADAQQAAELITRGGLSGLFYSGIILGNLVPLAILFGLPAGPYTSAAGILALGGIYLTEFVRVRAPQLVPLS